MQRQVCDADQERVRISRQSSRPPSACGDAIIEIAAWPSKIFGPRANMELPPYSTLSESMSGLYSILLSISRHFALSPQSARESIEERKGSLEQNQFA
jgi:hypothetical protein